MKTLKLILLLFISIGCTISSAQHVEHMKAINHEVWEKFYWAFESLDHGLMAEIHTKDLIRIPANQKTILDYATYINNYKTTFQQARDNNTTRSISLRFFERITNDSVATERGIYRFTFNKGMPDEHNYYGQFHVLLVKRDQKWQILMDYDSNENNSIGEDDYQAAFALDNFEKY